MAHLCLPAKICSCDANLQVAHNSPALAAYPGTAARPPVLNKEGRFSSPLPSTAACKSQQITCWVSQGASFGEARLRPQ